MTWSYCVLHMYARSIPQGRLDAPKELPLDEPFCVHICFVAVANSRCLLSLVFICAINHI